MRFSTVLLAASLAALLATSVLADTPASSSSAPPAVAAAGTTKVASADDGDKVVCINDEVTGSRIPGKRRCHTKREWDEWKSGSSAELSNMQTRGYQTVPPGDGASGLGGQGTPGH